MRGISVPVADLVLNTGTYAWDIPDDLMLAEDYRLTLTVNQEPAGVRKAGSPCSGTSELFSVTLSATQQRQAKGVVDSLRR